MEDPVPCERVPCAGRTGVRPTLLAVTEYADPDLETIADLPPLPPAPAPETPASGPERSRSSALAVGATLVVVSLVVSSRSRRSS